MPSGFVARIVVQEGVGQAAWSIPPGLPPHGQSRRAYSVPLLVTEFARVEERRQMLLSTIPTPAISIRDSPPSRLDRTLPTSRAGNADRAALIDFT